MSDLIDRQAAIVHFVKASKNYECGMFDLKEVTHELWQIPPAEPEPISQAYAKAVWTWLLDYQIKSAELKGRYSPYEVLSWVVNDWRKENGLDRQTGGD